MQKQKKTVSQRIGKYLDKGTTPEKVALKIAKENNSNLGTIKAYVTMEVKRRWIASLSPVKQRAAILLDSGLSPEKVALQISKENKSSLSNAKAWVTMVVNDAESKGIPFKKSIKLKVITVIKKAIGIKPIVIEQPIAEKTSFGDGKKNMRRQVLTQVKQSAKLFGLNKGTVLTLSCVDCDMEADINAVFENFRFLSYERLTSVFKLLKAKIKSHKFTFMLPPINDVIFKAIDKAKKDTYAHLFLDFCQSLIEHTPDIEQALKKDIVQLNGIVWITVSVRVKIKGYCTMDELLKLVKESGENRYELLPIPNGYGSYRDGTPMVSIILRRIK